MRFKRGKGDPVGVLDGWTLIVLMPEGRTFSINGYAGADVEDTLRVADAMLEGVRAAGFDAELIVKHATETPR